MKSLLEALKEGRLIELPEGNKEEAFELLAHIIEAVPDIGTRADLMKDVMEREALANTAIGRGIACPHCRGREEGELLCAVGWSPTGIDYGAPDGKRVHLLVMYYIPDRERNAYLKEISGLAKAIESSDTIETISALADIQSVREKLLDWVGVAISASMPDAKARMIKLEARQAATAASVPPTLAAAYKIVPLRIVAWKGGALVLCHDQSLGESLEALGDLGERLSGPKEFEAGEYRIAVMSETAYARDRREFEAVALRLGPPSP